MLVSSAKDKFACWCEKTPARKAAAIDAAKETIDKTQAEIIELKGKLADDRVLLEETKAELEADEKFFEETKASCKNQAAEWAERSRLRTEELAGALECNLVAVPLPELSPFLLLLLLVLLLLLPFNCYYY